MGIVTKLQQILSIKSQIKNAIEKKGVEIGNSAFDQYPAKISEIRQDEIYIYSDCDVRFIDFDGKELIAMSNEDFLALESMPSYPTSHEGLTFVQWNWTLAEAKAYVTNYGGALIGATMTTSDGATRMVVNIGNSSNLKFKVQFNQSKANGVLIDWGDGNTQRLNSVGVKESTHTYSSTGKYVVSEIPDNDCTLTPICGSWASPCGYYFGGIALGYTNKIEEFYFGRINTSGQTNLLSAGLKKLVLPTSHLKFENLTDSTGLYNLNCVVIPKTSATSAGSWPGLATAIAISYPHGITSVGSIAPYQLREIIIPEGVTSIGADAFRRCCVATRIILPGSVTSIGNYAFNGCCLCKKLVLSEGLTTIGQNVFNGIAYCCSEITIPSTVTSIGGGAFSNATYTGSGFSLTKIHVKSTTPPTLGSGAFPPTSYSYTIYVPSESVEAYQTATNWSAYASKIEAEPTT